jgi:pimeloyl-ACP methyl ester carboxylesterase
MEGLIRYDGRPRLTADLDPVPADRLTSRSFQHWRMSALGIPYRDRMTTFALVHGAWHGGWCWEKLSPFLQQTGHDVVAPDLPCDDGSATTFDPYADVVCAALAGRGDDVVVVAHSLGGATGTLVAARRPVRRLVYLCAAVPQAGRSFYDQWQQQPDIGNPHWAKD